MNDVQEPNRDVIYFLEPLVELVEGYFDAHVEGLERLPEGAALLVGNHSGGVMTPDSFIFLRHLLRHTNFDETPVTLGHDLLFDIPILRRILCGSGVVPASRENAVAALRDGHKVLVYPGGDWEVHRPSSMRDQIDFGGRKGFVKIALEADVPVVPVVSAGGHDGWYVITRGERIAHTLRLDKLLRLKVFPIALAAPMGLLVGPISVHIPLPSRILVEVLEPLRLQGNPERRADLEAGYQQVTGRMQTTLDRLAARLPGRN
ncbi:MAG: lysophospholipid acyltransferase family protein [Persicimonas sp.]